MIACIDGGLLCGPILAILYICGLIGVGAWLKGKFKWCKKSCDCECHETGVNPKYKCPSCGKDYKDHKPGLMGGVDCP